jgi:hypothetical protein
MLVTGIMIDCGEPEGRRGLGSRVRPLRKPRTRLAVRFHLGSLKATADRPGTSDARASRAWAEG